ncbi:hypothetical protein MMC26_002808 [Xylographa opegraphella]|nr:hypothetical protein [Xylographa opegraphella]
MRKGKNAGRSCPVQPPSWTLGLLNPFKAIEHHQSTHELEAHAQRNLNTSNEPLYAQQPSQLPITASSVSLRQTDKTSSYFPSARAFSDHTQSCNATLHDSPMIEDKKPSFHWTLSGNASERRTIPITVHDNAFHSQFETVRKSTDSSSLYNTMTIAEYLSYNEGGPLLHGTIYSHVDSSLKLEPSMRVPGCFPGSPLVQPSADELDFLELRRKVNTWLEISRLRNGGRHPKLRQYISAVLQEFEDGYKELEDKLAEKLFPLSGVRY